MLPRPGALARGHYRPNELTTGVPRRGHCRPTNVPRSYRRVGTVGFCDLLGAGSADYRAFPPTKKDPRRDTTGSDLRRATEARCSRTGTLKAQIPTQLVTFLSNTPHKKWCNSGGRIQLFPPWSPSSFAVDDVPYSCAEQYMLVVKTKIF